MAYAIDAESFIHEMAARPVLWDLNCEDNRHKNKKQRAWDEIARLFVPDFDEMNTPEKLDVYRKLNNRWRNMRDSYVRNMKKKPGQKPYMYTKQLSFLDNLYHSKQNDNPQTDEDEWSEEGENKKRARSRRVEIEWQSGSENSVDDTTRKKIKTEENPLDFLETPLISETTCNFPVEDDDKAYFDSLLPVVRSFNMDQKLEFRSQVLNLVKKIRRGVKTKTISLEDFDE